MTFKRFEDIEAWQLARQLTRQVYQESRQPPMRRDWRYCSQIQSAAVSMMSNIAEGFLAQTNNEFVRFLTYSIRSSGEVSRTAGLYVALDNEYINQQRFDELYEQTKFAAQKATNLKKYLEGQK
jgi:four helix bundle protein